MCITRFVTLLGTLSNYDDHGSKNIAEKKMNLRPSVVSNFIASIWNRSIVGDFSWR